MLPIANNCKQLQTIEGDTDTVTDNVTDNDTVTATVTVIVTVIVTDTGTDSGAIYARARVCNAPQKCSAKRLRHPKQNAREWSKPLFFVFYFAASRLFLPFCGFFSP